MEQLECINRFLFDVQNNFRPYRFIRRRPDELIIIIFRDVNSVQC